jgi:hypothetical protein
MKAGHYEAEHSGALGRRHVIQDNAGEQDNEDQRMSHDRDNSRPVPLRSAIFTVHSESCTVGAMPAIASLDRQRRGL